MKMNSIGGEVVSSTETARILGISLSSVRNWVKHGFIEHNGGFENRGFALSDVLALKGRIERGELERLSSRANKIKSSRVFSPDELFGSNESKIYAEKIASHIIQEGLETSVSMFMLSLNLLKKSGLLMRHNVESFIKGRVHNFRGHGGVLKAVQAWKKILSHELLDARYHDLLHFHVPQEGNILGAIYQSILQEGEKSKLGSYYTPEFVVESIIERTCEQWGHGTFLDPCCGTGQFLLSFAGRTGKPENVYGIDIDHVAVNIARVNLLLKFPNRDFYPNIYCNDSLQNYNDSQLFCNLDLLPKFDLIATNPPWGYHYGAREKKNLEYFFPEISSGESFSFFLVKSLSMLKRGGLLSFVLPESILNVKLHGDIRRFILENASVKRIETGKKIFKKVFSPALIMDIEKTLEPCDVEILNSGRVYKISGKRFQKNSQNIFDIDLSKKDESLVQRVFEKNHVTLTNENAIWGLGIVTGNNKKYLSSECFDSSREPVVRGRDIFPFGLKDLKSYIEFAPENFQQCIAEDIFRSPVKLIYKYISNRMIFTSDSEGLLTLNSANIVIPQIQGIPIYFYEGLFNSELYNFIFSKKFSSVKVLKGHLQALPIPVSADSFYGEIESLVLKIKSNGERERVELIDSLNDLVYDFYGFPQKEREYVRSLVKN